MVSNSPQIIAEEPERITELRALVLRHLGAEVKVFIGFRYPDFVVVKQGETSCFLLGTIYHIKIVYVKLKYTIYKNNGGFL